MIDFVTINGEAYTLITDEDYTDAKMAMAEAGIDELPVSRACTDDVDDLAGEVADCDVIQTSSVLCATSLFYEVTLFDVDGEFHVNKPNDLGRAYPTEDVAIKAIADGFRGYTLINEDDLPALLNNDHYTDLNLYRLEGKAGPSYVGIAQM